MKTMDMRSTDERHDAFMRLFLAHEPRLYAYIRASVFSEADASDILQETSMVLWRKFDAYEPGTHFDRWAFRIAKLQILCHRKKRKRDHLVFREDVLTLIEEDEARDAGWSEDVRDRLRACLSRLPESERTLLAHRYIEGRAGRAIAELLGRSEASVSRGLSRVTVLLMRCLKMLEEARG